MKRTPIRAKRKTPRRRPAPRWSFADWLDAGPFLEARSGGVCEWCGSPNQLERHHRKRRRDGGETFSNIVVLCRDDHRWAHEHPVRAREVGLIVSVSRDPEQVPFLSRRREWVWLREDGSAVPLWDLPSNADAHDVWA